MMLTDKQEEDISKWNVAFGNCHVDSVEGEDTYSMAFGFFLALGNDADQCHDIMAHTGEIDQ